MNDCLHVLSELAHLVFDTILAVATICLAIYTRNLWYATQGLLRETKAAAEKQLGVNTWLDFIKRFDTKKMNDARRSLAGEIYRRDEDGLAPVIGEEVLEFFEEVGIAWNEHCIDRKLAHSSFSYDAENWWYLVQPYVGRMRIERDDSFYYNFEAMIVSMRAQFPADPEVTREMALRYLRVELGLSSGGDLTVSPQ